MRFLLQWISLRHFCEKRSLLTIVGIALGISIFISIRAANTSILNTYRDTVHAVAGNTTLEIVGPLGTFDEETITKIRNTPGVSHLSPIVQSSFLMTSPPSAKGEVLLVIGVDLLTEGPFREYELRGISDEAAFEALMDPSALLLTEPFAKRHQMHIGDAFETRYGGKVLTLRVIGFLAGSGLASAHDGNIAIMDIASAQWLMGKVGLLDRVDLITEGPTDEEIRRLNEKLGGAATVRRPQQRGAQVEKMLASFQMNLTALSTLSLFVGIFLIYTTLFVSVIHRRREIGILRAIGASRASIFLVFTLEGALLGIIGGVLGVFLGAFLARAVLGIISKTVTSLYVPIAPFFSGLSETVMLEGIGIGVGVATLSSLFPAFHASRLRPREALEGIYASLRPVNHRLSLIASAIAGLSAFYLSRLPTVRGLPLAGYLSAAALLIGFSLMVPAAVLLFSRTVRPFLKWAPPAFRFAEGHLVQAMRRNVPTISAWMGALSMMISVSIMIESFRNTVIFWIDQTIQADIIGGPVSILTNQSEGSIPIKLFSRIKEMPGVAALDPYRSRDILLGEKPAILVGRDLAVHARHSRYLFRSGNSEEVIRNAIQRRQLLISEPFANQLSLREGEVIHLPSPQGLLAFEIGGIFYDYSTDGGKLVMDRTFLEKYWKDDQIDVVAIYLKEGEAVDLIRKELVQSYGDQYGITFITQASLKDEILKVFDQTFVVTYALEWIAVLVALLGITNTLFVAILERRREIGIVRAIGGSGQQVAHVVMIEAFYIGIIGNVLGIICGFFLSLILIFVINKQSFGWTIVFSFPLSVIGYSFLLASLTSLAAGYFPARRGAKINIAEAISYE